LEAIFLESFFICVGWLNFLCEEEDRIYMPRRSVDNLEGVVVDEKFYECALGHDIEAVACIVRKGD
jgi:hypothetical protein